jgi:hypothetical protein
MEAEMKFEFELNDHIAEELVRQTLNRALGYAVDEVHRPNAHEEDRAYYRSLSEALDIVLDYFGEDK